MDGAILAVNAGSSSLKFGLYHFAPGAPLALASMGEIDDLDEVPHFVASDRMGACLIDQIWAQDQPKDPTSVLAALLDWVDQHLDGRQLIAVGHRVVHGGREFTAPTLITPEVLRALWALRPLAPLHQSHSLAPVDALISLRPGLAQIACFDTAFHQTMPWAARRLGLSQSLNDEGVCRYGFHGLSYAFIIAYLRAHEPELAKGRVIVAHLGSGASLCAMANGQSIDTTMGFSTLDGLVMSTRCGALDPGVLLYFLNHKKLTGSAIEQLLYEQSGLLAVSGLSGDMRVLLASDQPGAHDAIALFNFHVVRQVGALTASLGGLDGLIFTGGIGEHAPAIRAGICSKLTWLGVYVDDPVPAPCATRISRTGGPVEVHVIHTNEESMIADETAQVMRATKVPAHG